MSARAKVEYLSIAEAAAELDIRPWAIWHACRLGILPSIRPGTRPGSGRYRIARADFEAYKRASQVAVPQLELVDAKPVRPRLVECAADVLLIDQVCGTRRRR